MRMASLRIRHFRSHWPTGTITKTFACFPIGAPLLASTKIHARLARGGKFTAETQWMIHAWIWKDSPTGVFSPTHPTQ